MATPSRNALTIHDPYPAESLNVRRESTLQFFFGSCVNVNLRNQTLVTIAVMGKFLTRFVGIPALNPATHKRPSGSHRG
jgi:hypothetical protein